MRATHLLFVLFCQLFCLKASALSRPASAGTALVFEDSARKTVSLAPLPPEPHKRPSFFARLSKKVVDVFFKNTAPDNASTKSVLGWIALGATGLGIILLAAGAGPVGGVLVLGGILAGIVTLFLPKSKEDRAAGKKSNTGAIIAIVLGVGLIVVIAIALSNWK